MAADPGIFQQYLKPVRSVADYSAEMDSAEQNKLALAASRMSAQQAQQSMADDQAVRQATIQSAGDSNKLIQALHAAGNYKAAQAVQKQLFEGQKAQADISHTTAQTGEVKAKTATSEYDLKIKQADQSIKDISSFNSPQEAVAHLNRSVTSGAMPAEKAQAILQSMPQDPAQFSAWQLKMLRGIMTAKEQIALQVPDANAVLTAKTSRENNAASNATTQRGQNMTDARGRESTAISRERLNYDKTKVGGGGGGKPLPAAALKMQQEELNAIGTASAIQADLGAMEQQIAGGKLKFGGLRNLVNTGKNMAGFSDEESRNLSSFKSSLERLRNDSLRLNSGVQTDGDAQRAWNELFENINDTNLVKQRLGEIKKINERAVNIRKMNVDSIRGNYGHDSMDTGGYQNQPAAVGAGKPLPGGWSVKEN